MTREQAAGLLARLMCAFPSQRLEKPTQAEYLRWLSAMPFRQAERGVAALIGSHQYPTVPTIAEIREAAGIPLAAMPQLIAALDRTELVEGFPRRALNPGEQATGWVLADDPDTIPLSSLPQAPALHALPAPVVSEEQAAENRRRFAEMTRSLTNGHRIGGVSA